MRQKFFRGVAFRTVAVLLLGMTAASAMNAVELALPAGNFPEQPSTFSSAELASQRARPAGCHSHEVPTSFPLPIVPATVPPAPRNYQCCVTGHHAVIPLASFSLRLVLACVGGASGARQFSLATTVHFPSLALISPFGSPPGSVALRI
jgi:hypothetical protein